MPLYRSFCVNRRPPSTASNAKLRKTLYLLLKNLKNVFLILQIIDFQILVVFLFFLNRRAHPIRAQGTGVGGPALCGDQPLPRGSGLFGGQDHQARQ